jgi:SAM-dependent methyltransferase
VDVSSEQVAIARSLGVDDILEMSADEHLRGRREEFDLVLAIDVLEHQCRDELLPLLDSIHAALRPGGQLLLQVPNADGPLGSRLRYADLTHEQAFTATSISQALRTCGFSRITVVPVDPAPHGLTSAARWALWHLIRAGIVAYLAVETGVVRGHILSQNLVAVADR